MVIRISEDEVNIRVSKSDLRVWQPNFVIRMLLVIIDDLNFSLQLDFKSIVFLCTIILTNLLKVWIEIWNEITIYNKEKLVTRVSE